MVREVSERHISLPADASSPRAARRFVTALLEEAERPEWLDAAQLAVSEVVTNAVLHAHSAVELSAHVDDAGLRVEVHDADSSLPSQRTYDAQATTGRGMALVAAVTSSHGVTALSQGGKAVWFVVGDEPPTTHSDEGSYVSDESAPAPGKVAVVLLSMPPTLWLAARQHHDTLLREVALQRVGSGRSDGDLADADEARRAVSDGVDRAIAEARARGLTSDPLPPGHPSPLPDVPPSIELRLLVDRRSVEKFSVLQDVLDYAERLAAEDKLLARPGLPEVVAIRDWACEQVIAQYAGTAASPWPGADEERFTTLVRERVSDVDWDPALVAEADRGAVAADDANRIIAVSRPLADALGWSVDELVGRRVVALVPPRFREAHVAGFTRHLATGEANVLGVELELPVLRQDGSEVACAFLIEAFRTARGRAVYVAWITPPES